MPSASLSSILTPAVATGIQAGGTILGGMRENQVAQMEAQQLDKNAGQQLATSQRAAAISERQAQLLQSKIRATAGASGAGASDITVQNVEADVGRQGEYNALSDLYSGESTASAMKDQASLTRFAGKQNLIGSYINAAGRIASSTIAASGKTMLDKYGGDMPPWMANNYGVSLPGKIS